MTTGRRTGGRPTTDAGRALAHVESLVSQCPGLTPSHVMRLAGLGNSTIVSIRASNRIAVETEEAILAVQRRHVALCPPPHVPAKPAVAHLRQIMAEAESTMDGVARATGIKKQTIGLLLNKRWSILNYPMYQTIMALTADDLRGVSRWTERQPSITRARALQANGHALGVLSVEYGIKLSALVSSDPAAPISVTLAEKVLAMYRDIGDRPGTSNRARNTARRHGYYPPIYYDEDMNLIEVDEEMGEQARAREALCILGLTLEGKPVAAIVEAIGTSPKIIAKVRRDCGVTIGRSYSGDPVAEASPDVLDAIRKAIRPVHYRTTIESLDDPDTDYVDLLARVRECAADALSDVA